MVLVPARNPRITGSQTPMQQHSPSPGPPLWESALKDQSRVISSPVIATPYSTSLVPSPARHSWGWRQSPPSPRGPPRGADSETSLITARALGMGGTIYPPWLYGGSSIGFDLSDPFPSMWCSALFLHVHPKKQVRQRKFIFDR
jgi:hypothetical protein